MFSYDSKIHKGKITTVDTDDYVAWKDGYYQFHQQPSKEIVKKTFPLLRSPYLLQRAGRQIVLAENWT